MLKVYFASIVVCFALSVTVNAAVPDKLVVAIESTNTEKDAPLVKFASILSNALNTKLSPYPCPWARCLKAIEKGHADIILSVFKTPDRTKHMMFIEPALAEHKIEFQFLQKRDTKIDLKRYEDLRNYAVITQRGNKYFDRFDSDNLIKKLASPNYQNGVDLLLAERADLMIDLSITKRDLYLDPSKLSLIKAADYSFFESKFEYLAVSRNSVWRYHGESLSEALELLKKSGHVQNYIRSSVLD